MMGGHMGHNPMMGAPNTMGGRGGPSGIQGMGYMGNGGGMGMQMGGHMRGGHGMVGMPTPFTMQGVYRTRWRSRVEPLL